MAPIINLVHGQAKESTCEIDLFGGTITSWKVEGVENIFVSAQAVRDGSKAIRGGVPVCFPSFGPWEFGPQHGFARISDEWTAGEVVQDPVNGDQSVTLTLVDTEKTRAMWDFSFRFDYKVTLKSRDLVLDSTVVNTGDKPLNLTYALHTYFKVDDVTQCEVTGLQGLTYTDKTDGAKDKKEVNETVKITGFTDRVYQRAPDACTLKGLAGGRTLKLTKTNFADTVVWNPWAESAAKMADFGDEEYKTMICVEAVQTTSKIEINAGDKWTSRHGLCILD